jgi:hypothetical protein
MKLYNILLLLHGEMNNQVRKELVTAAEIQLLRGMHVGNNDAVKDIQHVANVDRTDTAERRRLALLYGTDSFALDGEVPVTGIELVNRHYPPGTPLPQEVHTDEGGNVIAEDFTKEQIEYIHPVEAAMRDAKNEIVTMVDKAVEDDTGGGEDPFADEGVADVKLEASVTRRSPLRSGVRTAV